MRRQLSLVFYKYIVILYQIYNKPNDICLIIVLSVVLKRKESKDGSVVPNAKTG